MEHALAALAGDYGVLFDEACLKCSAGALDPDVVEISELFADRPTGHCAHHPPREARDRSVALGTSPHSASADTNTTPRSWRAAGLIVVAV